MIAFLQILAGRAPEALATLLQMEIQIALLVLLVLVVERAFPSLSSRAKYALWLVVLAKAFLPPVIPWPRVSGVFPAFMMSGGAAHLTGVDAGAASPGAAAPSWILGGWIAVSVALLATAACRFAGLRRELRDATPLVPPPGSTGGRFAGRWPVILVSDRVASPLSLGFFRPCIVIPRGVAAQGGAELRTVLFHELAHVLRRDAWIVLLQSVAQILHPFPHLRFMNARLARHREEICDGFALDHARVTPREYGRTLVRCLEAGAHRPVRFGNAACFVDSARSLEERLRHLVTHEEGRLARLTRRQRLVVAGLAIMLLPMTLQCSRAPEDAPDAVTPSRAHSAPPNVAPPADPGAAAAFDRAPLPVRQVSPEYPAAAREAGREGTVVIQLLVGTDGKVAGAKMASSSETGVGFEESALAASSQWEFTPAMKGGQPVAVWIAIPFRFELGDQPVKP